MKFHIDRSGQVERRRSIKKKGVGGFGVVKSKAEHRTLKANRSEWAVGKG